MFPLLSQDVRFWGLQCLKHGRARPLPLLPIYVGGQGLRPCRPAIRVISPVAVETDHAPFDAVAGADHAAVLDDRIVDLMPLAVGHQDGGGAVASWDRTRAPRLPCDLLDSFESHYCEGRIPEPALLGGK